MDERLLREWVRNTLVEQRAGSARAYFETWDDAFSASGDPEVSSVKLQRSGGVPDYSVRNASVRLMVNLDPSEWKGKPKEEVWPELGRVGKKALEAAGINVTAAQPRLLTQGSGTYPSIKAQVKMGDQTREFVVVLNPGFKIKGSGGTAGPGEPEMEGAGLDERFKARVDAGGTWTVIFGDTPETQFPDIVYMDKWKESTKTGEPKTDILLRTKGGKQVNFSLKGVKFPGYEGLSPDRVDAYGGKDSINCVRFMFILNQLRENPEAFQRIGENEIMADLGSIGGTQLYPLPSKIAIPIVYGTKTTGGPVDYVVKAKGGVSLEGVFDDEAGTLTFPNMMIVGKNPDSKWPGQFGDPNTGIPEGDTPVIAFRTATGQATSSGKSSRRVEVEVNILDPQDGKKKPFTIVMNKVRQMVLPGEQRNASERATLAQNADVLENCRSGTIREEIRVAIQSWIDNVDLKESIPVSHQNILAERLLLEAIPKADRKEIEKIVIKVINNPFTGKRQLEKQTQTLIDDSIKKALGVSFFGFRGKINDFVIKSIQDEVAKWIADKKTKQQIAEITKSILKKFYRELSLGYSPVIDRLKVN
jgi:hypothetical protein